ncbi:MAG: hypothetical protein Q8M98_07035 [Candidatus Cloacimonadaceae bacterium]|nr:hypothetical protein [Candidatus Cloacimonadaceae bacterium]
MKTNKKTKNAMVLGFMTLLSYFLPWYSGGGLLDWGDIYIGAGTIIGILAILALLVSMICRYVKELQSVCHYVSLSPFILTVTAFITGNFGFYRSDIDTYEYGLGMFLSLILSLAFAVLNWAYRTIQKSS